MRSAINNPPEATKAKAVVAAPVSDSDSDNAPLRPAKSTSCAAPPSRAGTPDETPPKVSRRQKAMSEVKGAAGAVEDTEGITDNIGHNMNWRS
eukprot:9487021-Pyramimonas_sp.AAC.1